MKEKFIPLYRTAIFLKNFLKERSSISAKNFKTQPAIDLHEKGIFVFPTKLKRQELKLLQKDFDETLKLNSTINHGQENGRLNEPGLLRPILKKYLGDINPILDDYFGAKKWKVEITYYQQSSPEKKINDIPGGEFHVDDNKTNIKYFIYLTDVSPQNGPFSLVPFTHRWQLKKSFIRGMHWAYFQKRKSLYDYALDETWCRNNEKPIIGASGTRFLVDTTAVHRAQPVLKGDRKVVVMSFNRA